jgi:hypothetical protein
VDRPLSGTDEDAVVEEGQVDEVEATRLEIEQTRAEMSETVDAIQERLSPDTIKEQAKDRVKEAAEQAKDTVKEATVGRVEQAVSGAGDTARETGSGIVGTIRENPIPAALTGIGLGWLLVSSRRRSSSGRSRVHSRTYDYSPEYGGSTPVYGGSSSEYGGSSSEYGGSSSGGSSTGQAVGQARERTGEVAGQAQERVGQVTEGAQNQAARLGAGARRGAQRASSGFQRMLQENPLAVGALGIGTGVAVGLAIPETSKEHEVMGEARDNLVQKGQEKAQETQEKVKQVAQEAQSAAKQEAENQGLSSSS